MALLEQDLIGIVPELQEHFRIEQKVLQKTKQLVSSGEVQDVREEGRDDLPTHAQVVFLHDPDGSYLFVSVLGNKPTVRQAPFRPTHLPTLTYVNKQDGELHTYGFSTHTTIDGERVVIQDLIAERPLDEFESEKLLSILETY